MPLIDFPKIDWGNITTIRAGDVAGPASGISTSSQTNKNAQIVYALNQEAFDGREQGTELPSRRHGIRGQIHGQMLNDGDDTEGDYDVDDSGGLLSATAQFEGTPVGHPVASWFGLIAALVLLKYFAEKAGEESEFKTIRVGAMNIIIITLSSAIGFTLAKWFFGIYQVPGLSPLFEAV